MKTSELLKKMHEKNIYLHRFDLAYMIPTIKIVDGKEIVESFELKFEEKREDD